MKYQKLHLKLVLNQKYNKIYKMNIQKNKLNYLV